MRLGKFGNETVRSKYADILTLLFIEATNFPLKGATW